MGAGLIFAHGEDIIVNYTDSSVIKTGWQTTPDGTAYDNQNYVYLSGNVTGTVTFPVTLSQGGSYQVYIWLPVKPSGANPKEQVDVYNGTSVSTVPVPYPSLKIGGWQYVGTYQFPSGGTGSVKIKKTGSTKCIADAVRLLSVNALPDPLANEFTVNISGKDRIVTEPSVISSATSNSVTFTGPWSKVTGGFRSDGNMNKGQCSATFSPELTMPGEYDVYTVWKNTPKNSWINSPNVSVIVQPMNLPGEPVPQPVNLIINQQQTPLLNGINSWTRRGPSGMAGRWLYLGRFRFGQDSSKNNKVYGNVTITNDERIFGNVSVGEVAFEKVVQYPANNNLLVDDSSSTGVGPLAGWTKVNDSTALNGSYICALSQLSVTFSLAASYSGSYSPGYYGVYFRYGARSWYSTNVNNENISILDGGVPIATQPITIDETKKITGQWVCLGYYQFSSETPPSIRVSAPGGAYGKIVSVDAINFILDESQNDVLPGWWKIEYFGTMDISSHDDFDGDGLTNYQEYQMGTDPTKSDTDGDGIPDNVDACPLDPTKWGIFDPSDHTPPIITIIKPAGAILSQ